jgi:hypothetical protein
MVWKSCEAGVRKFCGGSDERETSSEPRSNRALGVALISGVLASALR